jgi:hypothetical protein
VVGGRSEKKSELFFVPFIRTPARSNVAAAAQIGGIETQAEMLRMTGINDRGCNSQKTKSRNAKVLDVARCRHGCRYRKDHAAFR